MWINEMFMWEHEFIHNILASYYQTEEHQHEWNEWWCEYKVWIIVNE